MSPWLWIGASVIFMAVLGVLARRVWRGMVEVMRHGREG